MRPRIVSRCVRIFLAAAATLAPASLRAGAQGLSDIADKTVVAVAEDAGRSLTNTVYIAPSGRVYQTTNMYSVQTGHAPSDNGFIGPEFEIGKTIEYDGSTKSLKCHNRTNASLSDRVLTLTTTATCAAPGYNRTASVVTTIEFQGKSCSFSQTHTPDAHQHSLNVTSCHVVEGNQLQQ